MVMSTFKQFTFFRVTMLVNWNCCFLHFLCLERLTATFSDIFFGIKSTTAWGVFLYWYIQNTECKQVHVSHCPFGRDWRSDHCQELFFIGKKYPLYCFSQKYLVGPNFSRDLLRITDKWRRGLKFWNRTAQQKAG